MEKTLRRLGEELQQEMLSPFVYIRIFYTVCGCQVRLLLYALQCSWPKVRRKL